MRRLFYITVVINLLLLSVHFFVQYSFSHSLIKGNYIQPEKLFSFSYTTLIKDTIDSNTLKENDFIVLNFWATWCEPCINEINILNAVKEKFSNSKIKFIAISCDNNREIVQNFLNDHSFVFEQVYLKDIRSQFDLWAAFSQYEVNTFTLNLAEVKSIPIHVFFNCKTKKIKVIKSGFYNEKDYQGALNLFFKE